MNFIWSEYYLIGMKFGQILLQPANQYISALV